MFDEDEFAFFEMLQSHAHADGDVAQLVRASDRQFADAGSILRCGKGFFSQSPLSVQTLLRVSAHPTVCNRIH